MPKELVEVTLQTSGNDTVELPNGAFISNGDIMRDGEDLYMSLPTGETVVIEGYFSALDAPVLISPEGARMTPDMVDSFLPPQHIGQYADASVTMTDESPVGQIAEASGESLIIRADGTEIAIEEGMMVYQGDVIETDGDGAVNILFADNSSFVVSEDARLSIDEFVYNSEEQEGSSFFSMLKGMFVYTSGMIGKDDPSEVNIETPVGSIGIRGTVIAGHIRPAGEESEFTIIDGAIVITNAMGTYELNDTYETAVINSYESEAINVGQLSADQFQRNYDSVSSMSPDTFNAGISPDNSNEPTGEPIAAEPVATEPVPTEPVATEPVPTEPVAEEQPVPTEPIAEDTTLDPILQDPILVDGTTSEPLPPPPITTTTSTTDGTTTTSTTDGTTTTSTTGGTTTTTTTTTTTSSINYAPVFDQANYNITVDELTVGGTGLIYSGTAPLTTHLIDQYKTTTSKGQLENFGKLSLNINANDLQGDVVQYAITGVTNGDGSSLIDFDGQIISGATNPNSLPADSSNNPFWIDTVTGEIYVTNPGSLMSTNSNSSLIITVRAGDGNGNFTDVNVNVNINNIFQNYENGSLIDAGTGFNNRIDDYSNASSGTFYASTTTGSSIIIGSQFNDNLSGTSFTPTDDIIFGGKGNDTLSGEGGNDILNGGQGLDTLWGGTGNDLLFAGFDSFLITAPNANISATTDNATAITVHNALYGEAGIDELEGGKLIDYLSGGTEDDTLWGMDGDDFLDGGAGADTLFGGALNDTLNGGAGADILHGDSGNDIIYSGTGDAGLDSLFGDAGNDVLILQDTSFAGADGGTNIGDNDILALAAGGASFDTTSGGNAAGIISGIEEVYLNGYNDGTKLNGGLASDTIIIDSASLISMTDARDTLQITGASLTGQIQVTDTGWAMVGGSAIGGTNYLNSVADTTFTNGSATLIVTANTAINFA